MSGIQGKLALVTGGASGIGKAVSKRLIEQGATVVVSDISEEQGRATAEEIGAQFVAADLGQREACQHLVEQASAFGDQVDILVNNAGFQHVEALEDFPEDRWDAMLAVMLTAPFLLTRYCFAGMKAANWGRIINLCSIHGLVASPYKSAYVTAKHGMIGLTKVTALEGGEFGVTANTVCPAYVRTPLVEKQLADQARTRGISEEQVIQDVMLEPAAVKRLIEPEEVAELVTFLAGATGATCTGASFVMDLGWTAR